MTMMTCLPTTLSRLTFLLITPSLAWEGKSTVAASDPISGLAFVLKYLPVTVVEDNGDGKEDTTDAGDLRWVQGCSSVLLNGSYTERNFQLFSSEESLAPADGFQSMTPNGLGKDCSYRNASNFGLASTGLHSVFAYSQRQCCNACDATKGCVAASFKTSDTDRSGMGPNPLDHNWEGFAVHMAAVAASTTSGLPVAQAEDLFGERLANFAAFDHFMEHNATFFTDDLQPYFAAFQRDGVPCLLLQWEDTNSHAPWCDSRVDPFLMCYITGGVHARPEQATDQRAAA